MKAGGQSWSSVRCSILDQPCFSNNRFPGGKQAVPGCSCRSHMMWQYLGMGKRPKWTGEEGQS